MSENIQRAFFTAIYIVHLGLQINQHKENIFGIVKLCMNYKYITCIWFALQTLIYYKVPRKINASSISQHFKICFVLGVFIRGHHADHEWMGSFK